MISIKLLKNDVSLSTNLLYNEKLPEFNEFSSTFLIPNESFNLSSAIISLLNRDILSLISLFLYPRIPLKINIS